MISMIRRVRHLAQRKKNSLRNSTVTSCRDVSREWRILLSGGTTTKVAICTCHVWPKITLVSLVSFFFCINSHWGWCITFHLAASVAIEWVFSKGRLLLSHIRNRLLIHMCTLVSRSMEQARFCWYRWFESCSLFTRCDGWRNVDRRWVGCSGIKV